MGDDSKIKLHWRYTCDGEDHHQHQTSDGPDTAGPSEFSDILFVNHLCNAKINTIKGEGKINTNKD